MTHTSHGGRILAAMGKGVFAAVMGLLVVGITVALLAAGSAPTSKCAPSHTRKGTRINTLVPPGNSSVSEYVENVPTARGGCPSVALRSATRAGMISRATKRSLLARGRPGVATEALARATGPTGSMLNVPGLPRAVSNRAASLRAAGAAGPAGSSPLGAIVDALGGSSGGGGLGALLPLVLVICVLAIGGTFFFRLRRRRSGG